MQQFTRQEALLLANAIIKGFQVCEPGYLNKDDLVLIGDSLVSLSDGDAVSEALRQSLPDEGEFLVLKIGSLDQELQWAEQKIRENAATHEVNDFGERAS